MMRVSRNECVVKRGEINEVLMSNRRPMNAQESNEHRALAVSFWARDYVAPKINQTKSAVRSIAVHIRVYRRTLVHFHVVGSWMCSLNTQDYPQQKRTNFNLRKTVLSEADLINGRLVELCVDNEAIDTEQDELPAGLLNRNRSTYLLCHSILGTQ